MIEREHERDLSMTRILYRRLRGRSCRDWWLLLLGLPAVITAPILGLAAGDARNERRTGGLLNQR